MLVCVHALLFFVMCAVCNVWCIVCCLFFLFFFKQKTAYEVRISDWSSDVVDSALLDGEIVWLGPEGKPDFSGLQAALKSGGKGLTYFVFDLLEVDGEDLTRIPNILRKERLRGLILGQRDAVIQYADLIVGEVEKLLRIMCDAGRSAEIGRAHV